MFRFKTSVSLSHGCKINRVFESKLHMMETRNRPRGCCCNHKDSPVLVTQKKTSSLRVWFLPRGTFSPASKSSDSLIRDLNVRPGREATRCLSRGEQKPFRSCDIKENLKKDFSVQYVHAYVHDVKVLINL